MRLGPLDSPDYVRLPMPHMSVEALPLIGRHDLPVFVGAVPDGGTARILVTKVAAYRYVYDAVVHLISNRVIQLSFDGLVINIKISKLTI